MLRLALSLALAATVFADFSPADARRPVVQATFINIDGVWDSTYGEVSITQRGNRIHGEYQCCGGGTLDGYITGSVVKFHWREPHGAGEGEGVWRRSNDGTLQGSWGVGQSDNDGSTWKMWRPKQTKQIAQ